MKKIIMKVPNLPFALEEAMNKLRVNIKFCGKNIRKILIISSVPNEGKSFLAVQLWKMLAEAGFPTVLVDADLRKSILKTRHKYRTKEKIQGLDYFLSGLTEFEDVVCETNIPNGYVIPCTNYLENPSTLLEDPRMGELLDRLAEEYRYVIIDSPPLESVSDGALLGALCDGAILVIRAGQTSRALVRNSLQQLDHVGCKLLGTVLNRTPIKSRGYYKYYDNYYGKKKG